MRLLTRIFQLVLSVLLSLTVARAATISGTVKGPDGAAFTRAFVQVQNMKTRITVNVLTDQQGRYRVSELPAGEYRLQVKAVGFKSDPINGVTLTADQNASHDLSLQNGMVHWNDISMYQGKELFPDNKMKSYLTGTCWACHGFETRMASVVRDEDGWRDRVNYMRESMGFFLNRPGNPFTNQMADDLAAYLNSLFGENPVLPKSPTDMPQYKSLVYAPFTDQASKIVYVEYDMPGPSRMPWSAVPDKDGMLWIPMWAKGRIGHLNPTTGDIQEYLVPYQGPFNAAIHSAVPAPDGSVWIAEQGSNLLAKWDPVTKKITEFDDGSNGKHTIRVGPTGEIWFSGTRGSFDPKTGKFTHYDGGAYGIALDQQGNAWFASGNDLVRVDAETRAITKCTPPSGVKADSEKKNIFNRRIQVDTDGLVWFAEYNPGKLASFDPKTEQFKEYQLPGPEPTPYALGIDKDHNLWYSSELMDVLGRLDPRTGKVVEYPYVHSENTMREFFLDPDGRRMWYGSAANNKVGYFYLAEK